jgi:TetR/AcrR family transcriptional regulator, transcriptional repressor for nem operon
MRKSKAKTAETRKRIVGAASALFRSEGIHATGLAEVMNAAGLTHGGFYRHFDSKDQLVAEAFDDASVSLRRTLEKVVGNKKGKAAIAAIVENYLAFKHRDNPASGCAFSSMGSELGRANNKTRGEASRAFLKLVEAISRHLPDGESAAAKSEAIFLLSAMIGALTMARVVDDPKLSLAILRSAKDHCAAPR